MDAIRQWFFLSFLGLSVTQLSIPKREFGFVYEGGDDSALVKVDAFLDLLCPDSKAAYGILRQVADSYGPNVLRLRVHMFPLPYHTYAFYASKGAFAVDRLTNGKRTYDWFDIVFDNMETFSNGKIMSLKSVDVMNKFTVLAFNLGISSSDFIRMMSDRGTEVDTRLAWKYGCSRTVHSTPMVMINDVLLTVQNPDTVDEWKQIIDPLLS